MSHQVKQSTNRISLKNNAQLKAIASSIQLNDEIDAKDNETNSFELFYFFYEQCLSVQLNLYECEQRKKSRK